MSHHTRVLIAVLGMSLVLPSRVAAQSSPFLLTPGTRVMLEYKDSVRLVPIGFNRHRLVGVLLSDGSDAYRLQLPTGDSLHVRHDAVTRAWASRGVSRARSAVALSATFALTGFLVTRRSRQESISKDQTIGAAVGASVGAVLGLVRPFEMWKRVRR